MSNVTWMKVNVDKCMHCGACVGSCPKNAIFLAEVVLQFGEECTRCGRCVKICPVGAISMEAK
ncbi:MAG: 4Fe-4S dicluster domain-containing protein [Methanomassiliicoccales archaeon]